MTDLEQRYGLIPAGAPGILLAIKWAIALLRLFVVPDFMVADYYNAVSSPNYSNDAMVGEWID